MAVNLDPVTFARDAIYIIVIIGSSGFIFARIHPHLERIAKALTAIGLRWDDLEDQLKKNEEQLKKNEEQLRETKEQLKKNEEQWQALQKSMEQNRGLGEKRDELWRTVKDDVNENTREQRLGFERLDQRSSLQELAIASLRQDHATLAARVALLEAKP